MLLTLRDLIPRRRELQVAYYDLRARLGGWCNERPRRGGYSFWRCELPRHHAEAHRFNSYTWAGVDRVQFNPIDHRLRYGPDVAARSPWTKRHMVSSYLHRLRGTIEQRRRFAVMLDRARARRAVG